jgi:xanthine dehydrogenase YagR molybdenum-binding subunit
MLSPLFRLGLPLDRVAVRYGDSDLPGVVLAGGSQQTAAIGAALIAAHRALVAELLKLAGNDSPLAGLDADKVANEDAGLCSIETPAQRESYASILSRAGRAQVSAQASASPPLESAHWSMHSPTVRCSRRRGSTASPVKSGSAGFSARSIAGAS